MSDARKEPSPAPRQMRDRFAFLLILGATFGFQAMTLITGVITARILGVEGRGAIALVFALGVFASQLTFGGSVPIALAKSIAEKQVTARDGLRTIAGRRVVLLTLPCLVAGGVLLLLRRADPGGEKYLLAAAVFVMALQTIIFHILIGCLQGEGNLVRMASVVLLPQFLFTAALTTVWIAGWNWSVFDVLFAFFVSSFFGLVFAYASLRRPTRRIEDRLDESELWHESRRSYISSVRPLDSVGIDRILVGGLLGIAPLGLYVAATAVSNLCSLVGTAVTVIVLPRVAKNHADPAAQGTVIRRWVGISAASIVLMVIAVEIVVAPLIRIAFGEEFVGAVAAARWLILADGLMAFRRVLISVLQGQGRGGTASWIELALTPLMILGIVVAASNNSLTAIGISLVIVASLSCLALAWVIGRDSDQLKASELGPPVITDDR